jgi:hypothetical protein
LTDLTQIVNLRLHDETKSYFIGKVHRKSQRKSQVWLCSAQLDSTLFRLGGWLAG